MLLISITIILFHSALLTTAALVEPGYRYNEKSKEGPEHWGDLKKEWEACKNGDMQSPIDLSHERVQVVPNSRDMKRHYKPQRAILVNRAHDVAVEWQGDAGYLDINGTHFSLQQAHWHWPSEHTIHGRRFDLELHMVHVNTQPDGTNKTAVLAVLYRYGSFPDPFLSKLGKYMMEIHEEEEEEKSIGVIDPLEIKLGGHMYYKYLGSLTAPPCNEGVIWTINKQIRSVSREQVKLMKETVLKYYAKKNARPVQQLNEREVQLYETKSKHFE
ncbi:hypothetical protein PIB30_043572 [Stylosanthes scabra]|uniref:Carbonic anhydrase n=1 Tax=Stylosanthes scabra TaxID=79078 RepID=A0ABU6ZEB7_9FABA|nr:hypothetical protein [Stylosanthes scabra]